MHTSTIHLLSTLGLLGTVLGSSNSFPGSNVDIDTRSLDDIYEAAKLESGPLRICWGGDEDYQGDSVRTAWAQTFPDIELNLTVDLSKYHDSNIDRSWQRGETFCDVAALQTLHDYPRWKTQGRLLPYKPASWESLWASVKDPNAAFLPLFFYYFGSVVYNPALISSADLPASFADFTLPAWKGKLALTYPNDDDAIAYLFSLIINKYGWSWFEALATQDVQWVRGSATPGAVVGKNSTRSIAFGTLPGSNTSYLKEYFLEDEQIMTWAQTAAIFASTERPESAKLFISWLTSSSFQENFAASGFYVGRNDLQSGPSTTNETVWESKIYDPIGFNRFMLDRSEVELWKLQFESILGTAQGASPLHDEL
ncbi:periplasmic binding protein-like II [Morchella conica CCBAS932]|uniref:Periplasmic binding protein-like II n=1 Tax=Morchella conica CCBAS932 TaxID=1392247 RepID=A0A3N4KI51_9PEZI|nr:periplasmic binding protein-like II [Morchella conica CCBAS932]